MRGNSIDKQGEKGAESEKKDVIIDGRNLIQQSPLPTFVIDSEGVCVVVNKAFLRAYNVSEKMVLGMNALSEPANIKHGVVKYMKQALGGKVVETPEVDFITPYGRRRVTRSRLFPIFDDNENVAYVVVMHEDLTARKRAEEERIEAKKELAVLRERSDIIEAIPDVVFILDKDLNIIDWNKTAMQRTGYSPRELKEKSVLRFVFPEDRKKIVEGVQKAIEGTRTSREARLVTREENEIPHSWSVSPVKNQEGNLVRIISVGRNITEQKRREDQLSHRATHDTLTGLINRTLFNDRLSLAMAKADRERQEFPVILVDIDDFKDINDTLGHSAGDHMLQKAADRLKRILRGTDSIARMGGDEFLLLLPGAAEREGGARAAQKILLAFREPFFINGQKVNKTVSMGIAIYPSDGKHQDTLIKNADIAMYRAKEKGKNNFQYFQK